jgi:hypothetical protein
LCSRWFVAVSTRQSFLSADEYEAYAATAEILDDADAMEELRLADREPDAETVVTADTTSRALAALNDEMGRGLDKPKHERPDGCEEED